MLVLTGNINAAAATGFRGTSNCSRGLIVGVATCDFPPWGVGGTWEWDQTRGLLEVHCQSACRLGGWREWRGSCLEYKNRKGDPRRDPVAAKRNILLVLSSVRTLCCFFFLVTPDSGLLDGNSPFVLVEDRR